MLKPLNLQPLNLRPLNPKPPKPPKPCLNPVTAGTLACVRRCLLSATSCMGLDGFRDFGAACPTGNGSLVAGGQHQWRLARGAAWAGSLVRSGSVSLRWQRRTGKQIWHGSSARLYLHDREYRRQQSSAGVQTESPVAECETWRRGDNALPPQDPAPVTALQWRKPATVFQSAHEGGEEHE